MNSAPTAGEVSPDDSRIARLLLRVEIDEFNARYASVLDRGDLMEWPSFFSDNPLYRITSRENFCAGHPIGLIYCDSKAMLEDRATSILKTMVYAPRLITHYITNTVVTTCERDVISAEANFLLIENQIDRSPSVLMAGSYFDQFVRHDGRLVLRDRQCVYDTVMVQTSLIFPV
jgi:3-phenylpropionate/cinnamic acid dioxygenase small subunit